MDGERVHAAGEFTGKCRVDHAMALDSALPAKGFRYDIDPEVGLAAWPVAGMAGMLVRFVDDSQVLGIESFGQLSCDEVLDAHGSWLMREPCAPVNAVRQPAEQCKIVCCQDLKRRMQATHNHRS